MTSNESTISGIIQSPQKAKDEDRICKDFKSLQEKSEQMFNALRDLPQFGNWDAYFNRTFDVYLNLWHFQRLHREALMRKGLSRWEVGEIASRIGQLHYQYYLRSGDTTYLTKALTFYEAVKARGYFKLKDKKNDPVTVYRKLRYYARFILVLILLNKRTILKDLLKELIDLINLYTSITDSTQSIEWQGLIQEITSFLQADTPIHIIDDPTLVFNRRVITKRPHRRASLNLDNLELSESYLRSCILVGSQRHQIKLSELTLDVMRMALSLEHDLSIPTTKDIAGRPLNPKKYWLYRPSVQSLLQYIANAQMNFEEKDTLLLYISADGTDDSTCNRQGLILDHSQTKKESINNFYPDDLVPFLRGPMFIIIESPQSNLFLNLSNNVFGTSAVVLAAPQLQSPKLLESTETGSLFTWFLHEPLSAFLFTVSKTKLSKSIYQQCSTIITALLSEIEQLLQSSNGLPSAIKEFMTDGFLSIFIRKYMFCYLAMYFNVIFDIDSCKHQYLPSISPEIPDSILHHEKVIQPIKNMYQILGAGHLLVNK